MDENLLLSLIENNAKMEVVDLAAALNETEENVDKTIKDLEKNNRGLHGHAQPADRRLLQRIHRHRGDPLHVHGAVRLPLCRVVLRQSGGQVPLRPFAGGADLRPLRRGRGRVPAHLLCPSRDDAQGADISVAPAGRKIYAMAAL